MVSPKLPNLSTKFHQWKEWLLGEDVHSIRNQIHSMIWDAAVWQSVNESRRYARTDSDGKPLLNDAVHDLLNRTFFQTQALAIRRLLDRESREGGRAVTSLWRLLRQIQQNRSSLTRQAMLSLHGYPYDHKSETKRFHRMILDDGKETQESRRGLLDCAQSRSIHEAFDSMAGVDANARNPDDVIQDDILSWLMNRLEKCREIYTFVNKFVAHSAAPESRAALDANEVKITLGKILEAHRIICTTAFFVSLHIFNNGFGNVPATPQFNQFEHFEKPWATEETVTKMYEFWGNYRKQTDAWRHWDWRSEILSHP